MANIDEPPGSDITPPKMYANRREFLKKAGLFGVTAGAWGGALIGLSSRGKADPPPEPPPLPVTADGVDNPWHHIAKPSKYDTEEAATEYGAITTYNNFYELGVAKSAPAKNAGRMRLRPWTVRISGEVQAPMTLDVDDLVRRVGLEERIYRMRCVEAWSMVIPWVGLPLSKLIKLANPTSNAKYVKFTTLVDPKQLPGQKRPILPWPYEEALRIDEAMNELTMLAVGLYGAPLLGQNGAPIRLVVPWKYGFKGGKSIVEISFTERQPRTTWNSVQSAEYGFYANVNPEVSHPRWSQASERRIGQVERVPTAMFNGYGKYVAHMYSGMDLVKHH